ncbi:MAG: hypothetical protein VX095_07170 [Pseudomonadota bacterium]|nr:hypothetical protein [Pseudomonadota bacterium]
MLQKMNDALLKGYLAIITFHSDERGDNENLGRMLMLALVLIPIVILIATMGNSIFEAASNQWDELTGTPGAGGSGIEP